MSVLRSSRIVLGVTGGIAAYKAADLASRLVQFGAAVDVVMTKSALQFVGALTFQAITKRPVHGDVFEDWTLESFGHITLAQEAHVLVVAPASANSLARLAHGFTDDMLGAVALATGAPLIVAPAMEHGMYHHPATQENLAVLSGRGAVLVGPETGRLASGHYGDGRMAAPETILGAIRLTLGRNGALAGRTVVISAGGTREPLDPVRFIGNRSSGRMGFALAQGAIDAGARVTLIAAPSEISPPYGAEVIEVETAAQMLSAVEIAVDDADALIMAAAVADFRPKEARAQKIKKGSGEEPTAVYLVRNTDIVASVDRPGLLKIGFAAETDNLLANAEAKLAAKGLAMIVANDAVATIGSDESTAHVLLPGQTPVRLPTMSKADLAAEIVRRLADLLAERSR